MISRKSTERRAVTLTELLVVVAIISLLATIAVPVYIQKAEQAKIAVAKQEVREIAEAQQQIFAIHGFFVPIHILDNLPNLPTTQASTTPRDDFRNDSDLGQKFVMDPLGNLVAQLSEQPSLSIISQENDIRISRLVNAWTGPFLNAQRKQMGDSDSGSLISGAGGATQTEVSRALILDPWGRPYRMYSPMGIVGNYPPSSLPVPESVGLFPINIDSGRMTSQDQRFDRWAIVSFGRDGVSDSAVGKLGQAGNQNVLDDIFHTFGIVLGESFYRAF